MSRTEDVKRRSRLRELRLDRALSQEELAKLAGVARSTVYEAESERHAPAFRSQRLLAQALGVTPKELWTEVSS